MKKRIIEWGEGHILECEICFELVRRGYGTDVDSEAKYLMTDNPYPVKYRMIKGWGKDKGKEYIAPGKIK